MLTLLFSLQCVLAIFAIWIVLFKIWQITRQPSADLLSQDAIVAHGRQLMSWLYTLRVLPSLAMTLGMLVAMLDLAQALQGMGNPGMSVKTQQGALQHAFFAIGLALATAGVGVGGGSWLRAKILYRLEQLRDQSNGSAEITASSR